MQVPFNPYLARMKPLARLLQQRLAAEYEYASVLLSDSSSRMYAVRRTGISVSDDPLFSTRGAVVRVADARGCAEYSFNELSVNTLEAIVLNISNRLHPLPDGVSVMDYAGLPDEPLTLKKTSECERHPDDVSDAEIVAELTRLHQKGLAMDERLIECVVRVNYRAHAELFLSDHRELEQSGLWTTGMVFMMAKRGEEIKDGYQSLSCNGGLELLARMEAALPAACKTVLDLLDSEPITPGMYDCICAPDVTGMIVHEAFGHGVEMDMFVKDRALAKTYMGKTVASPLVTMRDGAASASEVASYYFDDEGTRAQDTIIIDRGRLVSGYADALSAKALGVHATGNGRRESYRRKSYTRMTNTFFEGGKDTLADMIGSVTYGFLLENPSSGMEDPKNWGIQCMVSVAREIKDGKLTGRVFSPIVLTGYVPDLLKSISMMSETVELAGGGYCGKGYKEFVKVSDGGPYIKAKIRLG